MNALHPTIKFTFEHSQTSIPFLDTHIYIDENLKLQSTLYRKPTDRMFLLHYNSHHPAHCKESIIYTQALRYCMIISDDRNLQNELYTLTRIFLARNYPLSIINKNITKALQFSHSQLLQPNDPKLGNERVTPFVTTTQRPDKS